MSSAGGAPPTQAAALDAVLSMAPLHIALLIGAGQLKYGGKHSVLDFWPPTLE